MSKKRRLAITLGILGVVVTIAAGVFVCKLQLYQQAEQFTAILESERVVQSEKEQETREMLEQLALERDEAIAEARAWEVQANNVAENLDTSEWIAEELSEALNTSLVYAQGLLTEWTEYREKIQEVISIRKELIERLTTEFQKSNLGVLVDENTGTITISESAGKIQFESGDATLSEESKDFFDEFLPIYLGVILQESYQPYLSEIIIEGYTDDSGTYMYNLGLSWRRAYCVAEYLLSGACESIDNAWIAVLEDLLSVNGCAGRDLITTADGEVDDAASRRVEIKFRLKEEEVLSQLQQAMEAANEEINAMEAEYESEE